MSASTSWWRCGKCAFANHPRLNQDIEKCEQCGADRSDVNAVDYKPAGSQ